MVTNIKMKVSTTDRATTDHYKKIRDQISEVNVYEPINLNITTIPQWQPFGNSEYLPAPHPLCISIKGSGNYILE